jgi:hypothetical protein
MDPKSTQISVDHQKLGTRKNRVESYKFSCFPKVNNRKRSKKNLQNALFLNTPKWIFISGPGYLAS